MNDGGPVYPTHPDPRAAWNITHGGMTLRDYFAALALRSLVDVGITCTDVYIRAQAIAAYKYADAMIEARDTPPAALRVRSEEKS